MSDSRSEARPLDVLAPLAGRWKGASTGTFGTAEVEKVGEFVLAGRFFRFTTRSVSAADVHEDVSFFSFDRAAGSLVLREFYTEGYVGTYRQAPTDGGVLVFESQRFENPPDPTLRARITIEVDGSRFRETLALATGGAPLEVCVDLRLGRV